MLHVACLPSYLARGPEDVSAGCPEWAESLQPCLPTVATHHNLKLLRQAAGSMITPECQAHAGHAANMAATGWPHLDEHSHPLPVVGRHSGLEAQRDMGCAACCNAAAHPVSPKHSSSIHGQVEEGWHLTGVVQVNHPAAACPGFQATKAEAAAAEGDCGWRSSTLHCEYYLQAHRRIRTVLQESCPELQLLIPSGTSGSMTVPSSVNTACRHSAGLGLRA